MDHTNGNYTSALRTPTGIAADPALTAHGVDQARELGERLVAADPPIERVYSSLYYRCLQTIEPFMRRKAEEATSASTPVLAERSSGENRDVYPRLRVRGETGLGEWYGSAPFEHPVPATVDVLESHFPALLDHAYKPAVVPTRMGESVDELHNRVAATMEALIAECDRDGIRAVLLCSHAAVVIALGRVLTGLMPENIEVEDFRAFTCGLSVYRRRGSNKQSISGEGQGKSGDGKRTTAASLDESSHDKPGAQQKSYSLRPGMENAVGVGSDSGGATKPRAADACNADLKINPCSTRDVSQWRGGRGVAGGWDCELNSDCAHLSGGEERGW